MRTALYTLGALLFVAGVVAALLAGTSTTDAPADPGFDEPFLEDGWTDIDLPTPESEEVVRQRERDAERMSTRLRLPHGTLTVRVRTKDGKIPLGIEVGYRRLGGEPRWLNANEQGTRTIVNAPLGQVTAIARGPGLPIREQRVHIEAGVPAEVVISLEPADSAPDGGAGGG